METYVQDVVNLIEYEELEDVALVGYSAAGALNEDRVDLTRFYQLAIPKTYVRCTRSQAGTRRKVAEKYGMQYAEIDAGHDPMISRPDDLAAILKAAGA